MSNTVTKLSETLGIMSDWIAATDADRLSDNNVRGRLCAALAAAQAQAAALEARIGGLEAPAVPGAGLYAAKCDSALNEETARGLIRELLGDVPYDIWMRGCAVTVMADAVTIIAPTAATRDWITRSVHPALVGAFQPRRVMVLVSTKKK